MSKEITKLKFGPIFNSENDMKKKYHASFTFIGKVTLYICIKIYNTGYKETPGYPLVLQITWPQIQTFRETLLRIFTKVSELVKLSSSIFDPHT